MAHLFNWCGFDFKFILSVPLILTWERGMVFRMWTSDYPHQNPLMVFVIGIASWTPPQTIQIQSWEWDLGIYLFFKQYVLNIDTHWFRPGGFNWGQFCPSLGHLVMSRDIWAATTRERNHQHSNERRTEMLLNILQCQTALQQRTFLAQMSIVLRRKNCSNLKKFP